MAKNCNYEQMLFFISLFEIFNYVFFQRINGQLWLTARKRERERLRKTVLEARNRIEIDRRVSLREKSPSLTLGNLLSSLKFQASRMLV